MTSTDTLFHVLYICNEQLTNFTDVLVKSQLTTLYMGIISQFGAWRLDLDDAKIRHQASFAETYLIVSLTNRTITFAHQSQFVANLSRSSDVDI